MSHDRFYAVIIKLPELSSFLFVTTYWYGFTIKGIRNCKKAVLFSQEGNAMSEFEAEVEKAKKELEQSLVPAGASGTSPDDEFLGDLRMQAQEYSQKLQDAAEKAKMFAEEKFARVGEKVKELQDKDPRELIEDAKEYARQKPGQTILISAAIGLVVGLLLRRK